MEEIIENADIEAVEEETPEAELTTDTDWEAEAKKARGIAQRLRTKLTKATEKKVVVEPTKEPAKNETPKTGELDETQLDYLDLKGISESEDIKIIEDIVKKTGMTVRQALKDDYVIKKLEANKNQREVKDATPSSTKRSGSGGGSDLATALAKYVQSGYSPDSLPTDFKLRSAVVNAVANETTTNKPAWHK